MKEISTTESQPAVTPTPAVNAQPAAKLFPKSANQPVSKFQYAKPVPKSTEPPVNSSAAANKPVNSPRVVQSQPEPKPVQQPVNNISSEPAKPATENRLVALKPKPAAVERTEDEGNTSKSLELMRAEALSRIVSNPKAKEADLTDPEILSSYVRMRDDQDPLSWMILGYNNAVSPDKLVVIESGEGGFDDFVSALPGEKPVYMYLNYSFGDTGRPRFIFMSYVPEAFNGLQKARVLGHRNAVESFIKYYQISWHCLSIEEITEAELNKKLKTAGGADYSVQESNKGNFSSYKKATKSFYEETDKRTQVKPTYTQGPLTVTPCDISGRAMVAPSTEFLKNTSEVFKASNQKY